MKGNFIFTDGACSKTGEGGYGVAWIVNDKVYRETSSHVSNTTNNKMELAAILIALKSINRKGDVTIVTDSEYAIGSITKGWKRKKNVELLSLIDEELKRATAICNIGFVHTKGHQKDDSFYTKWNNYVDKLAQYGSQKML